MWRFILFITLCFILCGCSTTRLADKEKYGFEKKIENKAAVADKQQVTFMPNMDVVNSNYADAHTIYSSSKTPSESGVYEYGNYIFVIVVIDYNKEKLASPEAAAMLRTAAMLRKKYNLPEFYDLSCSILENEDDEENLLYRRVSVFNSNEVKQLKAAAMPLPAPSPKINKKTNNQNRDIPPKRVQQSKKFPNNNPSAQIGTFCGDKNVEDDF